MTGSRVRLLCFHSVSTWRHRRSPNEDERHRRFPWQRSVLYLQTSNKTRLKYKCDWSVSVSMTTTIADLVESRIDLLEISPLKGGLSLANLGYPIWMGTRMITWIGTMLVLEASWNGGDLLAGERQPSRPMMVLSLFVAVNKRAAVQFVWARDPIDSHCCRTSV